MQMESRAAFLCDSLVSSVYDTICFRNRRRTDSFRQHAALCVNDAGKKEMHYSTTNTHQRRLDKQDWHGRCWRIAPSHRQSRSYSDSVVAITSVTDECRKDRLQGRRVDLSGAAWRRSTVPAAVHAHRRHRFSAQTPVLSHRQPVRFCCPSVASRLLSLALVYGTIYRRTLPLHRRCSHLSRDWNALISLLVPETIILTVSPLYIYSVVLVAAVCCLGYVKNMIDW